MSDFRSLLSLWFMPIKKRRNKKLFFCSVFMCEKIYVCVSRQIDGESRKIEKDILRE